MSNIPSDGTVTGDSPPKGKAGLYARVCAEAIGDRKLKPTARHVLMALGLFAGTNGCAWPSVGKLAIVMGGVDKRAIKRALRSLEDRGYIVCEYRPRRSTLYRLRGLDGTARGSVARSQNPPPPQGAFVAGSLDRNGHQPVAKSATHNNPMNNLFKQTKGTAQGRRPGAGKSRRDLTPDDWNVVNKLMQLTSQPKGCCAGYVASRTDANQAVDILEDLNRSGTNCRLITDDFWRWHQRAQTDGANGEGSIG